ncbi:endonuclease domain-containing protein [Sinomonas sp.]|uniref:endonuclease domain-containing protein n=1 Tax=Sinomonas sp. TaxID=1914986 RepID=UPI002FE02DEF
MSTPARTWLDLAMQLPHEHLVALGDHLLRKPRPQLEGRDQPYATKESLVEMLAAHPKMKGLARCRLALEDMRVGSDSVPETLLRLAMVSMGLPEPELQLQLDPRDPFSPSGDIGYRAFKIVIQYEGAHHEGDAQRLADARRDRAFRDAGWFVIHVRLDDLREDFRGVIRRIKAAIRERAA